MTGLVIVHSSIAVTAGRMARGGPDAGATVQALPSTRRATRTLARLSAAAADLIPASVATHRKRTAGYRLAGLRAGDRDPLGTVIRGASYRTARFNSVGGKSPRSLSRVNRAQQPCSVGMIFVGPSEQHVFHHNVSFSGAFALHEHQATGALSYDTKTGARPGNLTARKGNNAC